MPSRRPRPTSRPPGWLLSLPPSSTCRHRLSTRTSLLTRRLLSSPPAATNRCLLSSDACRWAWHLLPCSSSCWGRRRAYVCLPASPVLSSTRSRRLRIGLRAHFPAPRHQCDLATRIKAKTWLHNRSDFGSFRYQEPAQLAGTNAGSIQFGINNPSHAVRPTCQQNFDTTKVRQLLQNVMNIGEAHTLDLGIQR